MGMFKHIGPSLFAVAAKVGNRVLPRHHNYVDLQLFVFGQNRLSE